jgi:predicted RNA methylase
VSWHEAFAANGPLVELATGNGRVAIPVAEATGKRVIGIDSSPAMLAQARTNATAAGVQLDLRECDMRDFTPAKSRTRENYRASVRGITTAVTARRTT